MLMKSLTTALTLIGSMLLSLIPVVESRADYQIQSTGSTFSIGQGHGCLIGTNGKLNCWGSFVRTTTVPLVPIDLGNVTQVSAGGNNTCVRTEEGIGRCWGYSINKKNIGVIDQISTGNYHACYIFDEALGCVGDNRSGQSSAPNSLGPVTQVSAGGNHTCAIKAINYSVSCWGENSSGQDSVPDDMGRVVQVSAGYAHSCAINDLGVVKCWGSNCADSCRVLPYLFFG
jgi:alpha-tubulin suppressor-like RCC1 family protein